MAQPTGHGPQDVPPERSGTVLETDEDVRQALLSGRIGRQQGVPVEPKPAPNTGRPASPFRPTLRPPVPLLTVFDDGKIDGEVIRLREPKFTIGRTEGDLRLPMDGRMSSRHVEITHQVIGGLHRWVVTDLQSTHGVFVRVSKTALADRAEFLAGNGRYRFDANQPEPDATADYVPGGPAAGATQGWVEGTGPFRPPALTELLGKEIGNRILLVKEEYWIGSDPSCQVCRPDDPFCEPRHVRLSRGPRGHWHAEHNKTQNGLWLRMTQITVDSTVHFQAGEQRFKLKVN
jgi:hypothetical protein